MKDSSLLCLTTLDLSLWFEQLICIIPWGLVHETHIHNSLNPWLFLYGNRPIYTIWVVVGSLFAQCQILGRTCHFIHGDPHLSSLSKDINFLIPYHLVITAVFDIYLDGFSVASISYNLPLMFIIGYGMIYLHISYSIFCFTRCCQLALLYTVYLFLLLSCSCLSIVLSINLLLFILLFFHLVLPSALFFLLCHHIFGTKSRLLQGCLRPRNGFWQRQSMLWPLGPIL